MDEPGRILRFELGAASNRRIVERTTEAHRVHSSFSNAIEVNEEGGLR